MESIKPGTTATDDTKLVLEKEEDLFVEELTPSEVSIVTGGRVSFWTGNGESPAT